MTEGVGLRARKKEETRAALRRAALRLAAARGPDAVTVEEISAAAGVSPRTFFNYFAAKEEAIVGPSPDLAGELRRRLEDRPASEGPVAALRATLVDAAASFTAAAEDWSLRMQLVRNHPSLLPRYLAAYDALERELVEAVASRTGLDPDRDLYPSLVVACSISAMRVAVSRWYARARTEELGALVDDAITRLAGGLHPPEAARS